MTGEQYRAWRDGNPTVEQVEATLGALPAKVALGLAQEVHGVKWGSGKEAKAQLVKTTHDFLFSRERVEGIMAN